MKASVSGRVRNTSLPRTRPLLPVFEAVINAFQAIEEGGAPNGHVIRIHAAREQAALHVSFHGRRAALRYREVRPHSFANDRRAFRLSPAVPRCLPPQPAQKPAM